MFIWDKLKKKKKINNNNKLTNKPHVNVDQASLEIGAPTTGQRGHVFKQLYWHDTDNISIDVV